MKLTMDDGTEYQLSLIATSVWCIHTRTPYKHFRRLLVSGEPDSLMEIDYAAIVIDGSRYAASLIVKRPEGSRDGEIVYLDEGINKSTDNASNQSPERNYPKGKGAIQTGTPKSKTNWFSRGWENFRSRYLN